jgi:hypothetical protein
MTDPLTRSTGRLLTTPEVAVWLRLKPQTLEKMRLRGCGPRFVRLETLSTRGPIRYRAEDVTHFIEERLRFSTTESLDARPHPSRATGR